MKIIISSLADVSANNGFTGNLDSMMRTLNHAGHHATLVGISSTGKTAIFGDSRLLKLNAPSGILGGALWVIWNLIIHRPNHLILTQAGSPFAIFISAIARLLSVSQTYFVADAPIQAFEQIYGKRSLIVAILKPWLHLSERLLDASIQTCLTVSPGVDELMRDRGWKGPLARYYNVHNAHRVGVRGRGPQVRDDTRYLHSTILIYQGGFQQGFRGIEEHLEAVAIVRETGRDLIYILVGYGPSSFIEERADKLGIQESVLILDGRSPQAVANLLIQADVAAAHDLWYGLTSKMFEYLANGIHVFAVDYARDVHNICGDYVECFEDSPKSLADALIRFIDSKDGTRIEAREFLARLREENARTLLRALNTDQKIT